MFSTLMIVLGICVGIPTLIGLVIALVAGAIIKIRQLHAFITTPPLNNPPEVMKWQDEQEQKREQRRRLHRKWLRF